MSVIKKGDDGLVTDNSEREALFRKRKAKEAEKHLDNFLELFGATGLTPEREENIKSVPTAQTIIETGKKIGGIISTFEESAIQKIQDGGNKFLEGQTSSGKPVNIPASILIGLSTAVIMVESLVILVFGVFRGVCEAIMRAACALADLLFINFRKYFPDSNTLQQITIALIYFVGNIYANGRNLLAHLLTSIDQMIVAYVLVKYDKTLSSAVDNGINVLFNIIWFYVLLYFFQVKVLILAIIVLVIISFFLKMDELTQSKGFVKERAFNADGSVDSTGDFDFFAYINDTNGPLDNLLDSTSG